MRRVYCDFNEVTADDRYWILVVDGRRMDSPADAAAVGLKDGERILLFQDAGDFTVEADVLFGQTDPWFLGEQICARPDWSTRKDDE